MKYYIIAGERSGDLHGSNLIRELKARDPQAEIRCWGGEMMQSAGGQLVVHYNQIAYMGIWEVLVNLGKIFQWLSFCKKDLVDFNPDALILIDYPGFNMKMAQFGHENGFKVFYYISPKIWAWNTGRAKKIKAFVDRMFVILPFEVGFYKGFDYEVHYVGNPLVETVNQFEPDPGFLSGLDVGGKPVIAILPGSRKQEINQLLDKMLDLPPLFTEYQFVVAGVSNLPDEYYSKVKRMNGVKLVIDQTYDLLKISHAAVVASGTATLETALFEVPQVVCYKTSWFTYLIGRPLVKIDLFSLVNLIAHREVVRELIQSDFNLEHMEKELKKITGESPERQKQLEAYREIKGRLGVQIAPREAAESMVGELKG